MSTEFKLLTRDEEKKLSREELIKYYQQLRYYYKNLKVNKFGIKFRELLHPFLLFGVKKIKNIKLQIFNSHRIPNDGTFIFAVNHSNANDFPMASQIIKKHFYILADFTMKNDVVVNALNELNGVIYVDRKNKDSRNKSKNEMVKLLTNGKNILMFPEGTWNLEPSKLLLTLNWGIIDIAKLSGVPIIPIVLEYRDNKCIANIGDKFVVDCDSNKEKEILRLTDIMATLKWEIFESFPITPRESIENNYFEKYIEECLKGYKKFDLEYERSTQIRKYDSPDEVFQYIMK